MTEQELMEKIGEANNNIKRLGAELNFWRGVKREAETLLQRRGESAESSRAPVNAQFRGGRIPIWFQAANILREKGAMHVHQLLEELAEIGSYTTKQSLVGVILQETQRRDTFTALGKNTFAYNEKSNVLESNEGKEK